MFGQKSILQKSIKGIVFFYLFIYKRKTKNIQHHFDEEFHNNQKLKLII